MGERQRPARMTRMTRTTSRGVARNRRGASDNRSRSKRRGSRRWKPRTQSFGVGSGRTRRTRASRRRAMPRRIGGVRPGSPLSGKKRGGQPGHNPRTVVAALVGCPRSSMPIRFGIRSGTSPRSRRPSPNTGCIARPARSAARRPARRCPTACRRAPSALASWRSRRCWWPMAT